MLDELCCGIGCTWCDPPSATQHAFRKRDQAKDKRKRASGRNRQEKRRKAERIRSGPCDCWLCTPGALKRRMLRERARSRELQSNRVTYQNLKCAEW